MSNLLRLLAALSVLVPGLASGLPAFPGAEGYGSDTPGGRGGRVYVVTDLHGRGPGSLRSAIKARGPRIVVFAVSGTYEGPLVIREPYLTIAGQTAPGDGIAIHGAESGALEIKTHDVVIRHIRFRSGPPDTPDTARLGAEAHHVVLDHCSISWGVDENLAVGGHSNTIQWSIISEGTKPSARNWFNRITRTTGSPAVTQSPLLRKRWTTTPPIGETILCCNVVNAASCV